MNKVLRCRDVGTDCGFETYGKTAEEILGKVSEHARTAHGMTDLSPALAAKLRAAIREEGENLRGTIPSCGCA